MMSFTDAQGMQTLANLLLEERRAEAKRDCLAKQLPKSRVDVRLRMSLAAGLRLVARALDDQPLDLAPSRS